MTGMENTGVLLMNLGSPDSTSVADVRNYLMEFLMDGRVIDYPYLFRKILVGGIIVPFRAPKSAEAYRAIWTDGGSPLIVLTKKLQESLEKEVKHPVEIAMRYRHPSIKEGFERLLDRVHGMKRVIAIPLYPHYAMSSYETAVEYASAVYSKNNYDFRLDFIKPFYNHEHYITALCESIRPYLEEDFDHLLFSYHGIPRRHILKSDPTGKHCLGNEACCQTPSLAHATCYRYQVFETTRLVTRQLGMDPARFSISFQSRLGKGWLQPFTDKRLQEMPALGIKKLLVVSPAFVSDCLETLEEIAIRGRDTFLEAGGLEYEMIPCMNTHALWVQTIAGWIDSISGGKEEMLLDSGINKEPYVS
jgi:ferrochelatase